MSVQAIGATYDCRTPTCLNDARSSVGQYAYCDTCRKRRADAREADAPKLSVAEKAMQSHEQRAKDATKSLTCVGRRLDRAKIKARSAATELREAQGEWDSLVSDLQSIGGHPS